MFLVVCCVIEPPLLVSTFVIAMPLLLHCLHLIYLLLVLKSEFRSRCLHSLEQVYSSTAVRVRFTALFIVGASLVPATEAVKEARVLVAGEELESVTPRSKTRFPDVEGLSEVFLYSRALRRASACASVRVPPPSL